MAKCNTKPVLDLRAAFNRLGRIAGGNAAMAKLIDLAGRVEAKQERGEEPTLEEHVAFGLAGYDAGRFPADVALKYVVMVLEHKVAGDRIQEVYNRDFRERAEAIRKKHGLADDEDWPRGEGPPEDQALGAEFEAVCGRIEADVLREYADKTGHPLLKEAADQCASDRPAFERRLERGRQWLFDRKEG